MELFGRGDDLAAVLSASKSDDPDARALLVTGDAGVGKTSLINFVAAQARDAGVATFRCTGVQTEAGEQLAGLHQLLRPIREAFDAPPATSSVLDRAFTTRDDVPVGPFELANAILALLDFAASQSKIMLVIDDVQWLDEASSNVLAFVARRITNSKVFTLVGTRSAEGGPWMRSDIRQVELYPLGNRDAEALLDSLPGAPVGQLRDRIMAEAEGNPLALVELPKALRRAHIGGSMTTTSEMLPLSERLERVFAARVEELTDSQRALLLLCALDRTGLIATLQVASGEQWWLPDLLAIEDMGLVQRLGERVRFNHPLARSAVAQAAAQDNLRAAHAALAAALRSRPELWVWHRAAAATDFDAEVADALEDLARESLRKGGSQIALRATLRSVELTPTLSTRARRLAFAAHLANQTGQLMMAREKVAELREWSTSKTPGPETAETEGYANVVLAYAILNWEGDTFAAFRLLTDALEKETHARHPWVQEMLNSLLLVCVRTSRPEHWHQLDNILERMGDDAPIEVALSRDALSDPARTAHDLAPRLNGLIPTVLDFEPWRAAWMGMASVYIDNLPHQRQILRKVIEQEEVGGSAPSYWIAMVLSALDAMVSGQLEVAAVMAHRGLRGTEQSGFAEITNDFRTIAAMVAAIRGDLAIARVEVSRVEAWARPRGGGLSEAWIQHIKMRIFSSEGLYEEEYAAAMKIGGGSVLVPYRPHALWMFLETVEAAWKTGRHDEARAFVAAAEEAGLGKVSPRLAFHLAAARAITGEPHRQSELFAQALQAEGVETWPFERARLELTYGEWLRRHHDMAGARPHLREAMGIFRNLGSTAWLDRSAAALRATRVATESGPSKRNPLTPQEREIAELAARGLSTKDIASRLNLSPRTVGAHLYRIYPKLGIASRAALHAALADLAKTQD
ncbi:LuxR family transcriptional regulator [Conyzicola nivalis]|uniref:LuxR family transcriptional regulator n=1 Tax=Conyzicola nivalis TaxID=1477021 RepID=A0A916WFM0_9MICO|nr:LuxR family transcriptional regulator [Conyzicola nivalis]GGA94851.1 LuxR family transcriptional regulator [Conyzicola nivalis]